MSNKAKKKVVFLRGIEPQVYDWVKKMAKKNGYHESVVVNRIIRDFIKNGDMAVL